ncbi:hypothetical protein [Aeromonas sp. MR16]|uniref:hypothetical protein n=1 Tax=Aeromonas sp. MR16 TaxID=2923420 RepID=UPI001F4A4013|nr:hypothetical protein [Aeromonas sp. MR16]MCH7373738.1 hypothetical protein [Aeromonas sp. MR16]
MKFKSENNKNYIESFIKCHIDIIKKLDFELAIITAKQLGCLLWHNNLGVYELNDLESYLIDVAVFELGDPSYIEFSKSNQNDILFIATELYLTGGHSRLMERLSGFLDVKPDLLLSEIPTQEILSRESDFFDSIVFLEKKPSSVLSKLIFLLKSIINKKCVILSIHPDDIYSIVACGVAKKLNPNLKIHFINHADHVFSFGSSIADVWYEISEYGKVIDKLRGLKANKSFLGIPIGIKERRSIQHSFQDGDLILSAASNGKYKPCNNQSILPLVDALLSKYKSSKMQIIGVNIYKDYWWWLCKIKFGNRLVLSGALEYTMYMDITSKAKLYIDSHPFPGGTAFAEQFLQGKLCTGLISSYRGYSPAEKLKMNDVLDVISFINNSVEYDFDNVYDSVINIHGMDKVKERFLSSIIDCNYTSVDCSSYVNVIEPVIKHKIISIPSDFRILSYAQLIKIYNVSTILCLIKFAIKKLQFMKL